MSKLKSIVRIYKYNKAVKYDIDTDIVVVKTKRNNKAPSEPTARRREKTQLPGEKPQTPLNPKP